MSHSLWLLTAACLASGVDQLPPSTDAAAPPKSAPAAVAPAPCTSCAPSCGERITRLLERLHRRLCTSCATDAKPCDTPYQPVIKKPGPASCAAAKPCDCAKPCAKPCETIVKKLAPSPRPCEAVVKKSCPAPSESAKRSEIACRTAVKKPCPAPHQTVVKAPSAPEAKLRDWGQPYTSPHRTPYACAFAPAAVPSVIQISASSPIASPATSSESLIATSYVRRVGCSTDYSHLTGRLCYVHTDGGVWVVRYAGLDCEERYGGSVVLASVPNMDDYKDGDLVTVSGEVLDDGRPASRSLGGPFYRVTAITLINRPVNVSE